MRTHEITVDEQKFARLESGETKIIFIGPDGMPNELREGDILKISSQAEGGGAIWRRVRGRAAFMIMTETIGPFDCCD